MTRALVAGATGALVVLASVVGLLAAAVWLTDQQARRAERAAAVRAAEALAGEGA